WLADRTWGCPTGVAARRRRRSPHRRSWTWWRGWRHTAEEALEKRSTEREHRTYPARRAADARHRAQRPRGHAAGDSAGRLRALAGPALVVAAVDRPRAADGFPRGPDAPRDLPQSLLASVGRRDREHSVLAAPHPATPPPP